MKRILVAVSLLLVPLCSTNAFDVKGHTLGAKFEAPLGARCIVSEKMPNGQAFPPSIKRVCVLQDTYMGMSKLLVMALDGQDRLVQVMIQLKPEELNDVVVKLTQIYGKPQTENNVGDARKCALWRPSGAYITACYWDSDNGKALIIYYSHPELNGKDI